MVGPGDEEDEEESLDDAETLDDAERVVVRDEDGAEHVLIVVAVVEVDGNDYAMLVDEEQVGTETEEASVYLFSYTEDEEGNAILGEIEDEAVYAEVFNVCATLMDLEPGEE